MNQSVLTNDRQTYDLLIKGNLIIDNITNKITTRFNTMAIDIIDNSITQKSIYNFSDTGIQFDISGSNGQDLLSQKLKTFTLDFGDGSTIIQPEITQNENSLVTNIQDVSNVNDLFTVALNIDPPIDLQTANELISNNPNFIQLLNDSKNNNTNNNKFSGDEKTAVDKMNPAEFLVYITLKGDKKTKAIKYYSSPNNILRKPEKPQEMKLFTINNIASNTKNVVSKLSGILKKFTNRKGVKTAGKKTRKTRK